MVVHWLGLDPMRAGFFLGGTIHDVAQVVGAGYSMGQQTGDAATVVKLMRVAMLVPVIALAAWMTHSQFKQSSQALADAGMDQPQRPPLLPGFAVVFVLLVVINSLELLPSWLVNDGNDLSRAFLIGAMSAIGMKTHLKDILSVGWKPVLLMMLETLFLAVLFFAMMQMAFIDS